MEEATSDLLRNKISKKIREAASKDTKYPKKFYPNTMTEIPKKRFAALEK